MPESEIFKTIIQLGSFGLLAIAVVWMLYYGAPMIRDTIKALGASHEMCQTLMAAKMELQAKEQTAQVRAIVEAQADLVRTMDANCREERITLAKMLAAAPATK